MDEFDWFTDGSIALRGQEAIAVYTNDAGEVVIRRQAGDYESEDAFVIVQPENAGTLARAILEAAGADEIAAGSQKPRDGTGAERQRRYRERKRNVTRDADRDAVTPLPLRRTAG